LFGPNETVPAFEICRGEIAFVRNLPIKLPDEKTSAIVKRERKGFRVLTDALEPTQITVPTHCVESAHIQIIKPNFRGLLFRSAPLFLAHLAHLVGPG
jgi:hypothetical protein